MLTNFRDIGGLTLKQGLFYRSGQLTDLSQDDIQFLSTTCHLKKVYDMRSKAEIKDEPDTKIENVMYENIDILASAVKKTSASLNDMIMNVNDVKEAMLSTYKELVVSESALNGYRLFLTEVLNENEPILFHCFAGKDRTGFAAALLLKIGGASNSEIMTDYMKTNAERKEANAQLISTMKDELTQEQLAALPIALTVDKSYIEYANDVINQNFGDFNSYLLNGLKLPKGYKDEFKNKFVKHSIDKK